MVELNENGIYNPWAGDAKVYPVKIIGKNSGVLAKWDLSVYPSMFANGSVKGMKRMYWGKGALCVRYKGFIYNVSASPEIYFSF